MPKGRIIKAMSSFYYVEIQDKIYECKARGIFKKDGIDPMVGDFVEITVIDESAEYGVIEKVYPRTSTLLRPPIANATKALLVFGVKDPKPNLSLIDRFVARAQKEGLEVLICFNKIDLDTDNTCPQLQQLYERVGYKVFAVSVKDGFHLEQLRAQLKGQITVVAGPSGVGKSSLINALDQRLNLKTGSVSQKLGRGRHTTRYASLIDIGEDTWVVDTPGFSSLSLDDMEERELKEYFIEFHEYDHDCRFGYNCLHENEPDCAVKTAVEEGDLPQKRYESYLQLLRELREAVRRKY